MALEEPPIKRLIWWMNEGWGRAMLSPSEKLDLLRWIKDGTQPEMLPNDEALKILGREMFQP